MKIELGMILHFDPSDTDEFGIVYSVAEDAQTGKAAFFNICCSLESLHLRKVSVSGENIIVDERECYKADVRFKKPYSESELAELKSMGDLERLEGTGFSLTFMMKMSAMNPNSIETWASSCIGNNRNDVWRSKIEFGAFRKALYNLLACDKCEWLRQLWPICPASYKEIDYGEE